MGKAHAVLQAHRPQIPSAGVYQQLTHEIVQDQGLYLLAKIKP